jgi:hypothetical protein
LIKNNKEKHNHSFKRIKSITENTLNLEYEPISNVCLLQENEDQRFIYVGQKDNNIYLCKRNIENNEPQNVNFNLKIIKNFRIFINNNKNEIILFDNNDKTLKVFDYDFEPVPNKSRSYKSEMEESDSIIDLKVNESNDNVYGLLKKSQSVFDYLIYFLENSKKLVKMRKIGCITKNF